MDLLMICCRFLSNIPVIPRKYIKKRKDRVLNWDTKFSSTALYKGGIIPFSQ